MGEFVKLGNGRVEVAVGHVIARLSTSHVYIYQAISS
jgi:hypothetical protein